MATRSGFNLRFAWPRISLPPLVLLNKDSSGLSRCEYRIFSAKVNWREEPSTRRTSSSRKSSLAYGGVREPRSTLRAEGGECDVAKHLSGWRREERWGWRGNVSDFVPLRGVVEKRDDDDYCGSRMRFGEMLNGQWYVQTHPAVGCLTSTKYLRPHLFVGCPWRRRGASTSKMVPSEYTEPTAEMHASHMYRGEGNPLTQSQHASK